MQAQTPLAPDAARQVPRRWSDTADGIAWLPRLIDKARMAQNGALGAYLFGHSPFDAALLRRLGTTTDEFASIVASSKSDDEVLAALRVRGFDEARVRRWSARLPRSTRLYAHIWDLDDGYVSPGVGAKLFLVVWRAIERPLMGLLRAAFTRP